jgi:hypothetical protein
MKNKLASVCELPPRSMVAELFENPKAAAVWTPDRVTV